VPVVLLEQNATPGRATWWLARRADAVCVSFEETAGRLPRGVRCVVTGNPVRTEIAELAALERPAGPPRSLLVLGGSQGGHALNAAVLHWAARQNAVLADWRIVHQTGERDCPPVRQRYAELRLPADVQPFLADMAAAYRGADVVISRAGATTLAELACAGLPAVLVPYPHAAADHQRGNAEVFVQFGAAELVPEQPRTEDTAAHLETVFQELLRDPERCSTMSAAMRSLARPHAAAAVLVALDALGCTAAA
jgi:UDP-N-acetylglucosamine--N-acetylmuramyl-(pentapeptide) pyrophosphoryl-undecaprenol N-acetylglucosamine transferase